METVDLKTYSFYKIKDNVEMEMKYAGCRKRLA